MVIGAVLVRSSPNGLYKLEVYMDSQVGVSHIVYNKSQEALAKELVKIIQEENAC